MWKRFPCLNAWHALRLWAKQFYPRSPVLTALIPQRCESAAEAQQAAGVRVGLPGEAGVPRQAARPAFAAALIPLSSVPAVRWRRPRREEEGVVPQTPLLIACCKATPYRWD